MNFRSFFIALGLLAACGPLAQSADLINTINASGDTDSTLFASGWFAQSFSTTALENVVQDVTLRISSQNDAPSGNYSVSIYNYDTTTNKPSTFVSSIYSGSGSGLTSAYADVNFGGLNVTLANSTKYFLVLVNESLSGSDLYWSYTTATDPPSTGFVGTYYASRANSTDTWISASVDGQPLKLKIVASATVPEPSTYLLTAIGSVTVMGLIRQRKTRSKSA
jgi:hypothetical protein